MKIIGLIIIYLFSISFSFAQTKLNLDEFITYETDFEENVLSRIDSSKTTHLFLAISKNPSERIDKIDLEIESLISDLETLNIRAKKPKKKIKALFDFTHSKMLKKYEEDVDFEDIFYNSTYNCVTASALYCILLEHFEIPYHIIEEPTHVYVLTYPNTENIILETTLPNGGFYAPSNSAIEKAVKQLITHKYITEEEVQMKGYEKAYHDYFYSDEPISLKKLASLQYYNKSVGLLKGELTDLEEIDKALNPILKAQYLSPSDQNNIILYSLLGSKLNLLKLDSLKDFKNVVLFYENERNINNGSPIAYFSKSIETELSQNGRTEFVSEVYSYLKSHIKDTVELNREYNLGMSKYYLLASEFEKSLHFSKRGYLNNPKDVTFHSFIKHSIFNIIADNGYSNEFQNELDQYEDQFGSLLIQNKKFQGIKVNYKIYLSAQKLQANRYTEGLVILDEIEADLNKLDKKPSYQKGVLANIYAEYCAYYYRKGNITKSKIYLNKGLEHDKNNPALIRKKDILK